MNKEVHRNPAALNLHYKLYTLKFIFRTVWDF